MDLPLPPLIAIRFPRGKRRIEKIGRFRAKQAVLRVRIHFAPPHSLACFPTLWRSDEIGAWGAIHARPWTRRMPTAAAERENRLKFSVRDFGMSICEPADILRRSVLGKNAA
jgi:hypothetical protein